MAEKHRTTVRADIKRNRLYITLFPPVNKVVLEKIYTDVRFCVADLRPGFDVITDLSHCTIGHLSGIATLRKIMSFLVAHKVGRVIRVVGKVGVILKQLMGISSKFQSYKAIYVTSIQEAEEELDRPVKPSLRFDLHRRQIEFSVHDQRGQGYLVEISSSGCAVEEATIPLAIDAPVTLVVALHSDRDESIPFTLAAQVVSVQDDRFTVQFDELAEEQRELLYRCLAYEIKREIL